MGDDREIKESERNDSEERIEMLDWEKYYKEEPFERMPWHFPMLDYDVEAALSKYEISPSTHLKVLDIGTGIGTQASQLAKLGFQVTATDISPTAIKLANEIAEHKKVEVDFIVDDIRSTQIQGPFDIILDRGTFHTLHEDERDTYVDKVFKMLKTGGYFLLKTYSTKEEMWKGPYRYDHNKLRRYFETKFKILLVVDTEFEGMIEYYPMALFSVMQKQG